MSKLLVANRGEIACRIMRSAQDLGLPTVAVYSSADRDSLHVASADEAVEIGPGPARESYLIIERVLDACRATGAKLVHPGYGFLAENASFARAVEADGLIFVGPTAESIERMGDKARAREAAAKAGVPILPGSGRFVSGELDGIEDAAKRVGYPLLVKASAGGGGIGMRRVDRADELMSAALKTQELAERAFGDGTIYLERYVARARHIEVQVFGFGNGEAISLPERDCSTQRRFQKVIEESPAPHISDETRTRLSRAARDLARAGSYRGAGTVEFVVDTESFEFYFLEMNTRIQVEHPVTEMVTGIDLVAMQLKLALGRLSASDLGEVGAPHGHAIECRICAEDPARNFLPSPGRLEIFRMPPISADVRVDTGFRQYDVITPFYDSMIAKLICRGRDRGAAVRAAFHALEQVEISGVRTNAAYLRAVLGHPNFAAGDLHTGFLEEHAADLRGVSADAAGYGRKAHA